MERKTEIEILSPDEFGYAAYLSRHSEVFSEIADSGYSFTWFAQYFYLYWRTVKKKGNLELWGNMGPHYFSQKISQFSEVGCDRGFPEYKSNIFIFLLVGSEKNICRELDRLKRHIHDAKDSLPFNIFLINFERLTGSEKSLQNFDTDKMFPGMEWVPSFNAFFWGAPRRVSVSRVKDLET